MTWCVKLISRGIHVACLLAASLAFATQLPCPTVFDPAAEKQLQELLAGQQLVVKKPVSDSKWPQTTVRQFVKTTPEHMVAMMTDATLQADLIPELESVKLLTRSGNEYGARFVLKTPFPLPNITYELVHRVTRPKPGVYRIEWKMQGESSVIKDVEGSATFEPYDGGTVFTYDHLVKPRDVPFLDKFESLAMKAVTKTAQHFTDGAEKARPAQIEARVAEFLKRFTF